MHVVDRVRQFIRRHALACGDTRVAVALSGGSDSVALADTVRALDAAGELRAAGFAHFNHQLRESADRDERFCAGLAASFGWPFCVEREDVGARAARAPFGRGCRADGAPRVFRAGASISCGVVARPHARRSG
jgi:tRNA(Ile)-lysidine synthase TilS/MesJ